MRKGLKSTFHIRNLFRKYPFCHRLERTVQGLTQSSWSTQTSHEGNAGTRARGTCQGQWNQRRKKENASQR